MIAIDSNVLIHAYNPDSPRHPAARSWLASLAESPGPWGLPVFCLAEFVRITTHPRVFRPPSTLRRSLEALEAVLKSPSVRLLCPGPMFPRFFSQACSEGEVGGNLAFDAQIVAVCRENGVSRLLTTDRDFLRFRRLALLSLEDDPAAV